MFHSWNPVTGCTKISAGCENCYAEKIALRLKKRGIAKYVNGFRLTLHYEALCEPLKWKKGRNIFMCSMADLFHEEVSFTFLDEVFKTIRNCPQHVFHILSKRSERMLEYASQTDWPFNAVPGVTVESKDYVFRIDHLRQIKAPQRFINMEPLLGPVPAMNLEGITYLDAAPEKGENARPFRKAWALDIERQCGEAGVEFCFRSEKTPLNK